MRELMRGVQSSVGQRVMTSVSNPIPESYTISAQALGNYTLSIASSFELPPIVECTKISSRQLRMAPVNNFAIQTACLRPIIGCLFLILRFAPSTHSKIYAIFASSKVSP